MAIGELFSSVARRDVESALDDIDRAGVPAGRSSRRYCLVARGKHYPPKLVVGLACAHAAGIEPSPQDYSGGAQSNDVLIALGYSVTACGQCAKAEKAPTSFRISFLSFSFQEYPSRKDVMARMRRAAKGAQRERADLMVLPEAILDAAGPYGSQPDDTYISETAKGSRVALVVGRVENDGEAFRLRADVVSSSGSVLTSYYKHADPSYVNGTRIGFRSAFDFMPANIEAHFPVATISGVRLGVLICHDILYPALAEAYRGRIDLLVTISGASNDTRKWLTAVCARAHQLGVPATHVCSKDLKRGAPGSAALVFPDGSISADTMLGIGPATFEHETFNACADVRSTRVPLTEFLSVHDRGEIPTAGVQVDLRDKRQTVTVSRETLYDACSFQRDVLANSGRAIVYVTSGEPDERIVRARAIENVVPIAVQTNHGFTVYNPTQYRQCSSYRTDRMARLDPERQTARSLLKRVPAAAYRSLLTSGTLRASTFTR